MADVEEAERVIQQFGWADYLVFAGMLAVSAIIGCMQLIADDLLNSSFLLYFIFLS